MRRYKRISKAALPSIQRRLRNKQEQELANLRRQVRELEQQNNNPILDSCIERACNALEEYYKRKAS